MFLTFQRYVAYIPDMFLTFQIYVLYISEIWSLQSRDMFLTFQRYVPYIPEICSLHSRDLHSLGPGSESSESSPVDNEGNFKLGG